jgi:hypothetical protein
MSAAPAGATVGMRVVSGDVPPFGSELVTMTGRRYLVVRVRGRQMRCLVLRPDDPPGDPVLDWFWAGRGRRYR